MAFKGFLTLVVAASLAELAGGHGRLIEPASRNAAWRYSFKNPPNYDDNENNCGGYFIQWEKNDGKCGVCGDPYHQKNQPHVYPGKYANNIITKTYEQGKIIKVLVDITSNHRGYFRFRVGDIGKLPMTEAKLTHVVTQPDGKEKWLLPTRSNGVFTVILQLPENLTCDHCVMQWWYKVGNNWGCDLDGTCGLGKGEKQESFVNCADIRIIDPNKVASTTQAPIPTTASNTSKPTASPSTSKAPHVTKMNTAKLTTKLKEVDPLKCKSVGIWRSHLAMDDWCRRNCVMGFCPASHCNC